MDRSEYDVAIIGGGSAGYAAARTCSAAGQRTVVIEGGEEVGGLCILRGCMPTKALLQSAEILHTVEKSGLFGVRTAPPGFDLKEIIARKDKLIRDFAEYRSNQLESKRFDFIRANASFTDSHTLQLSNGQELSARHFIIATGSVVAPPPLTTLADVGYITSDEALSLERLPKSMIVLGGGAVAVEFAQFFCRLGVRVTLIQRSKHLLKEDDDDVASVIEQVFRRERMTVFTGTNL
ncbi:MAG TPA: FAD-dependent oxidoreductase, partial [Verrucomicrobiae bacterium]|nr:FAD-dependent oxidoreductase [Verrucomicrobiae bacterium]